MLLISIAAILAALQAISIAWLSAVNVASAILPSLVICACAPAANAQTARMVKSFLLISAFPLNLVSIYDKWRVALKNANTV